jgi:hypothetical protein
MKYQFNPERLAYWYLRLNGFLTIENFIIHDEGGAGQRTDVDLMALRFPNRKEAFRDHSDKPEWMDDHPRFVDKRIPFAAFVEVTTAQCKLNGPWTDRAKENMPRAIMALGALSTQREIDLASERLYDIGQYVSDDVELGLVSFGAREHPELSPKVMQIVWGEVFAFIFDRFSRFERIKREHPQWDLDGHLLWRAYKENRDHREAFAAAFSLVSSRPNNDEIERYCTSKIRR